MTKQSHRCAQMSQWHPHVRLHMQTLICRSLCIFRDHAWHHRPATPAQISKLNTSCMSMHMSGNNIKYSLIN